MCVLMSGTYEPDMRLGEMSTASVLISGILARPAGFGEISTVTRRRPQAPATLAL
jgi:hypothetical protein